ncbi:hypothetical protein COX47_00570 [Candidatus Roizmanbacteria bacterium CG23_combo_of_CG06-09_8_20_14_all_35_49]|uniref:Fumarate reductase/succinate dehydrogenase flavoprotein-like C-terminal domain-containing protein n=1 Tax=Candidatus Roizmanbacteria bacterium CG23_combo_of_CG06-09_8_20_14_all_35_49 TaxID=1974863 RepID=A0A2G9Y9V2_9BACT|nr:MAG: hypothetical protein COX47_00570 [Candidatus Roizmanbacteria bacterium CG23_combo_of_CG06-09_8_20_14_all_35_49]
MIRQQLQKLMWEKVGIVRRRRYLKEALKQIKKWEKQKVEDMELRNMLLVSRLIVESALKRKKSLGCHYVL